MFCTSDVHTTGNRYEIAMLMKHKLEQAWLRTEKETSRAKKMDTFVTVAGRS
jgi:hypothetical protein